MAAIGKEDNEKNETVCLLHKTDSSKTEEPFATKTISESLNASKTVPFIISKLGKFLI